MKYLIVFLITLQLAFGSCFEDEDPALFHHVNVISGHLSLCFQDSVVEGGMPLPITRTYSSGGALQSSVLSDPTFDKGWTIFPHIRLYWEGLNFHEPQLKIYLLDKAGNPIKYAHKKGTEDEYYLYPVEFKKLRASSVNSRKNPEKNYIKVGRKTYTATLYSSDGSILHYKIADNTFGYLEYEVLPSKHCIFYTYENNRLSKIELKNPSQTKVLSSITFDTEESDNQAKFTATGSDGKILTYQMFTFKEHDYVEDISSNCRPHEHYAYEGQLDKGARVNAMNFGHQEQFTATYYPPKKGKKEDHSADKIHVLKAPLGPNGELIPIGTFTYSEEYTDVRDVDNHLIRYHHTNDKLNAIEYFDKYDKPHSILKFFYKKNNLKTKALFDSSGNPLFAKTFEYDEHDNVIKEEFYGTFTGKIYNSLKIDGKGEVQGREAITKTYKYQGKLISEENEIGGLRTQFFYVPDTDLIHIKITSKDGRVLFREFYDYDQDNLLFREVIDDGCSLYLTDLTGVTERHIKTYDRDPQNGRCLSITESYLENNSEHQLIKRTFTYNARSQIDSETIFDSNNHKRYTLRTDYDSIGNIKLKTTPSGHKNTYAYDSLNNLKESKEVGKLRKKIDYDKAGRPIRLTEIDAEGNQKITQTSYDAKGRPRVQIDSKGNPTTQTYDDFGNCTAIHFSQALDENLDPCTPIATFTHDVQGNILSHTDPKGYRTTTTYNTLRKPLTVTYPDGSVIQYFYNLNGTLAKTIHPDGTQDRYTYDALQRQNSKKIYSHTGELLSQETWVYNIFQLQSYTNPVGLTTTYTYDGAGRKIAEQAEDRLITYTYDPLGNLERTSFGGYSKITLHNLEGDVFQQWEEDTQGTIENHTTFFYDHERRKEKAIRITSQGESTDLFTYDPEGRLCKHTDPAGESTQFIYSEDTKNALGQKVLTKTTIDQLGNQTIETFDALNRLVEIEKQDPDNRTVSKEVLLYDRSGNRVQQVTTIYQDHNPKKTYSIRWKYDTRGRVILENENDEKVTSLTYDKKGRIKSKKQPNGTEIHFKYDGLDRLKELYSSDAKLHYEYQYTTGPSPTFAYDKVHDLLWTRTYNKFGQITSEISPKNRSTWDYDTRGRCTLFTLPDTTAIEYTYSDLHLTSITRLSTLHSPKYTHTYAYFDENGHKAQEELIYNLGTLTTQHDHFERPAERVSPYNTAFIEYGPSGLVVKTDNTLFASKDYHYDPLNQLTQEGPKTYQFDSLGNPLNAEVNQLNQIDSTDDIHLIYDKNGNPTQRFTPTENTIYTYDPLNRLTSIQKSGQPKVYFTYDPFSRLYAKSADITEYFLYDQDIEIGLLNEQNKILELKVLGLGIAGDIGATVAIELYGQTYAPLHDFGGNIIGLISSNGDLVETYDISAFGQENCSRTPINPWRFNSKRSIEGLIFFGQRFYDPELGRWLTPDPAGFIDSPNLYLYVQNSPLNRLDLFGLDSTKMEILCESEFYHNPHPKYSVNSIFNNNLIPLKVTVNEIQVDWFISANIYHKIKVTPEEIKAGKIDITKHFHEIFPQKGQFIALTSLQNGVNTSLDELNEMCNSVRNMIQNDDHIFIGMHNPSDGLLYDLIENRRERKNIDTPIASFTRQILIAISENLHKINPELIHLHIAHSEGGAIYSCAFNGMTPEQQDLLRNHLYFVGVAPSVPISSQQAMVARNFYSKRDPVTGTRGLKATSGLNRTDFTIQFLECSSKFSERTLFRYDHAFMGQTYQTELKEFMFDLKGKFSFYGNHQ